MKRRGLFFVPALMFMGLLGFGCTDIVELAVATPRPPVAVVASASLSAITVAWATDSSGRVAPESFNLYGAIGPWTDWNAELSGAVLSTGLNCCSHTLAELQNEATYSVALRSVSRGGVESELSTFVTARPPGWRGTRILGESGFEEIAGASATSSGLMVAGSFEGPYASPTFGGFDFFLETLDARGDRVTLQTFGGGDDDIVSGLGGSPNLRFVIGETAGDLGTEANAGDNDAFVLAVEGNGEEAWTRLVGTTAGDAAQSVEVTESNAFVAGWVHGYPGNTAAFVAKYDDFGQRLWLREIDGLGGDVGRGIAVDGAGNVYVVGDTDGDLDGEANSMIGTTDVFVAKFDSGGFWQWTRLFGTPDYEVAFDAVTDDENIYVVGNASGDMDGQSSGGLQDVLVLKLDFDGARQWTRLIGSPESEEANYVGRFGSGDLLLGGRTEGNFGAPSVGGQDAFVLRLNTAGDVQWIEQFGSELADWLQALAIDGRENVYAVGWTAGATFDGIATPAQGDGFVVKLTGNGTKE